MKSKKLIIAALALAASHMAIGVEFDPCVTPNNDPSFVALGTAVGSGTPLGNGGLLALAAVGLVAGAAVIRRKQKR